jgi:hydrogenase maturation protease
VTRTVGDPSSSSAGRKPGTDPRILVAGIGNIFLGDDGFGVEVANRLAELPFPPGIRVSEFGIRGIHLAYELLEACETLILIDAVPMGEAPGTVAVIETDAGGTAAGEPASGVVDAHTMGPDTVLGALARLGGHLDKAFVVGCQPAVIDEGIGLSGPVAAAVEEATGLCCQLIADLTDPDSRGVTAVRERCTS